MVKIILGAIILAAVVYFLFKDQVIAFFEKTEVDEWAMGKVDDINRIRKIAQLQAAFKTIESELPEKDRLKLKPIKDQIAAKVFESNE